MAIKKITELPEQAGTQAADDLFVNVDTSEAVQANKTKKIRADKIIIHLANQLTANVVEAAAIKDGAVTTNKLGTGAVTQAKLSAIQKNMVIEIVSADEALASGTGKLYLPIPADLNGATLVDADAFIVTTASSGNTTVQLVKNDTNNMMSTEITVNAGQKTSYASSPAPVINSTYAAVATGNWIRIDITAAGTGAKGLLIMLTFTTA